MKLVWAIISDDDAAVTIKELTKHGFSVTKLCSTGGFLKAGNTTILSGINDDRVDEFLGVINEECKSRKKTINISSGFPYCAEHTACVASTMEVTIGGATVFVQNMEEMHKMPDDNK